MVAWAKGGGYREGGKRHGLGSTNLTGAAGTMDLGGELRETLRMTLRFRG